MGKHHKHRKHDKKKKKKKEKRREEAAAAASPRDRKAKHGGSAGRNVGKRGEEPKGERRTVAVRARTAPRADAKRDGAAATAASPRAAGAASASPRRRTAVARPGASPAGRAKLEPAAGPLRERIERGPRAIAAAEHRGPHRHVDLFDAYESIHYREFKILLKAEDFSEDLDRDVQDYWKLARSVATQLLLHVERGAEEHVPRFREIVFLDTPDADLYRNSFMLRVRREKVDGEPAPTCELTLKFRDPDIARALEITPRTVGMPAVSKFKEEILLVPSALGGMRSIFSHTCQVKEFEGPLPPTFGFARALFPVLSVLEIPENAPLSPAVETQVEEVLWDLGEFGFRGPRKAKVDMAVWRDVDSGRILIGEFAFESHLRHYGRLHPIPKLRSERLYRLLQRETGAWVELGTTKTARYYELSGRRVRDE